MTAYAAVAVFTLAFSGFPVVSTAVEICVIVLIALGVWWDFAKFMLASNKVFGVLVSHLSSKQKHENPGQVGVAQIL